MEVAITGRNERWKLESDAGKRRSCGAAATAEFSRFDRILRRNKVLFNPLNENIQLLFSKREAYASFCPCKARSIQRPGDFDHE
jgi:hypothetical protein